MLSTRQANQSNVHSRLTPSQVKAFENFDVKEYLALRKLGIGFDSSLIGKMMATMDAIQPTVTTASIGTPIQFLQIWLPGFVKIITAARKIDELVGISTVGSWEDEQVVQGVLERVGSAQPYQDYTNVPMSSWNVNFNFRTVIRFEEGMKVGRLESARAGRMQVDDAGAKREAAAVLLEIARNTVGFFGFNNGANNTYGFLNDPSEGAYVTVPNGASGSPLWSTKTFLEICKDIRSAFIALQTQSQDTINPEEINTTLALATNAYGYLSVNSNYGQSVRIWLKDTYPKCRVVSAPQLNTANGGAGVFYLYADKVPDTTSTDDAATFIQPVPAKFQMLGVQQLTKAYEEDYSNATAGVMCKRPYAMVRYTGIS